MITIKEKDLLNQASKNGILFGELVRLKNSIKFNTREILNTHPSPKIISYD